MADKEQELTVLEQILVDTINKATEVSGKAVDKVGEVTTKSIDFAIEQIPDIIHQLLYWKVAEASLYILLGFVLAYFLILVGKYVYKATKEGGDLPLFYLYFVMSSIVGGISVGCLVFNNLLIIAQIWIAPKIYLIEYASKLIKSQLWI